MKLQTLIDKIENMDYPQKLEKDWSGSCPCFWYSPMIEGVRVSIHGHCWRTTDNSLIGGCKCAYNGFHIKGKLPRKDLLRLAKALKKQLDAQEWYSPWEFTVNSLSPSK
jgi:hypothetical protein